jgi:putative sterol carrier protein|uniref:SCP2 domain-containing protein n=1 Tax=Attheya septentrionalis TaxID=420275 RepID=A0A7S2XJL6_9STRA|mmetsp:Transcript_12361/g.22439  ORF Transcript_12361/g.22439 Transcript_12361/m.22439 type:complete len:121 (+) Transcript_12361:40-402(+)
MSTTKELFAAMTVAVSEDPSLAKKFRGSVVFQMDDGEAIFVDFKATPAMVQTLEESSKPPKADLTVKTNLKTMQLLLIKKLTPQQAFMKRKLKLKGNMGLAMKLNALLAATRKQLPTSKL